MNLNDLASIATIVEAIFVIISVVFIWSELRQNNRLAKAANAQSLVEISSPFNLQLIQDRHMAELWVRGGKKYTGFDEVDKFRYKSLLAWWLILQEDIFYQWRSGLLDKGTYESWANDLDQFVTDQNLEACWDGIKAAYRADFVAHVDQLIQRHKVKVRVDTQQSKSASEVKVA